MLSISDLKNGTEFIYLDEPYAVMDTQHKQIGWGGGLTVRMKNLINGKVLTENFRSNDRFPEADLSSAPIKYLYSHRDAYWFADPKDPSKRFQLEKNVLGENTAYLKTNMKVDAISFQERIINIKLPIKMEFVVKDAPPSIKGNTAQGGTKQVTLETGASVAVPLFIDQGDTIIVNTQTNNYIERSQKAK